MCAPVVISDLESWTGGHGLGLELYRSGERIYTGHGGSMPGYLAHLLVHRPSRTSAILFANAYTLREQRIAALNTQPAGSGSRCRAAARQAVATRRR